MEASHEPWHRYQIQKQAQNSFIRDNWTFENESELLKAVEHSGTLKSVYSSFYIDGKIGEVTLGSKRPKIIDHTKKLEDSHECKTKVSQPDQAALGKKYFCKIASIFIIIGNISSFRKSYLLKNMNII